MARVNRDELIRRYAAGERNFAGVKLGRDLSGIDLSDADFSGNKMDEFSFERAILKRTSFINARLAQSCLDLADLTEADLRGTRLSYANLRVTNLTNADLRGARFHEISFDRANLTGANLSGTDLQGCILWEADLTGANLEGYRLRRINFRNTIMPDGTIRNS